MTAPVNAVGFTSQITAAFRAVEIAHTANPIIDDPLAHHLGKSGWDVAFKDWQQLVELQGPGKSLRIPARNRIMDDLLLQALSQLSGSQQAVQVVNIGCGMDSKPWRLQCPTHVAWFDVDQPEVMHCKQRLLQAAGAAVSNVPSTTPCPPASTDTPQGCDDLKGSYTHATSEPHSKAAQQQLHTQSHFPLLINSWRPVPADLSHTSLTSCLLDSGFDRSCPTIWLAEALLYYLPLQQALLLLSEMKALSGPGSTLIATCIDRELYEADHQRMDKGHYFHAMWFFSIDDLLQGNQQKLHAAGWSASCPHTTAELALQKYGRETYVPVYGGTECVFTAVLHAEHMDG